MSTDSAPSTIEAPREDGSAVACLDQHSGLLLGIAAGEEGTLEGGQDGSVSSLLGELAGRPSRDD